MTFNQVSSRHSRLNQSWINVELRLRRWSTMIQCWKSTLIQHWINVDGCWVGIAICRLLCLVMVSYILMLLWWYFNNQHYFGAYDDHVICHVIHYCTEVFLMSQHCCAMLMCHKVFGQKFQLQLVLSLMCWQCELHICNSYDFHVKFIHMIFMWKLHVKAQFTQNFMWSFSQNLFTWFWCENFVWNSCEGSFT